jgi:hypothetical protein
VEVDEGNPVIALDAEFDLLFELFLGVCYRMGFRDSRKSRIFVPFCWALSDPFERGPVCPRLQDLRIPDGFTQCSLAVALKFTLAGRSTRGVRFKRMSFGF